MPPKKQKRQKKKKKKSSKKSTNISEKSLKETILERHLQDITQQLQKCKVRVVELQKENSALEEKATKTRIESHEYMTYMGRKLDTRKKAVITLTDQNKELIKELKKEREELEEKFNDRKQDLEAILLGKKHVLYRTKKEMDDLKETKALQEAQLKRIAELEKEVIETRNHHANSVETVKEQYISEKMQFRIEAEEKIKVLTREANERARRHLTQYAENIQNENRTLRKQLQNLICKNNSLLEHRQHLEEQHKTLVWKLQYAEDLRSLHRKRFQKVHHLNKDLTDSSHDLENAKNILLKRLYSEEEDA